MYTGAGRRARAHVPRRVRIAALVTTARNAAPLAELVKRYGGRVTVAKGAQRSRRACISAGGMG